MKNTDRGQKDGGDHGEYRQSVIQFFLLLRVVALAKIGNPSF